MYCRIAATRRRGDASQISDVRIWFFERSRRRRRHGVGLATTLPSDEPGATKTPDRSCPQPGRQGFGIVWPGPEKNHLFRALSSPQQKPRSPGLYREQNARLRYWFRHSSSQPVDPLWRVPLSQLAPPLPSINYTGLPLGPWTPMLRIPTARSAAWPCNSSALIPGPPPPSSPPSTAYGVASCCGSRHALSFWNSPRRGSRRARTRAELGLAPS